jgi:hypothetical protein
MHQVELSVTVAASEGVLAAAVDVQLRKIVAVFAVLWWSGAAQSKAAREGNRALCW